MSEKLKVLHKFEASPHELYLDFVDPKFIKRWFMEESHWVTEAHTDLKIGGKYDVTMWTDIGNSFTHDGVFEEVVEDKKLRFTWGSGLVEDTDVTIRFKEIDSKTTEVSVEHEHFPTVELRDRHVTLWNKCLVQLDNLVRNPVEYPIYKDPDYYP
ncbi:MAG: hypothetical protein BM556_03440 [Bacteriovorax sp. MedPE-SWde]|nr:MAG: hypothetical protein BM556_03440 [Bacteriovorax sp. MedPE-SWde]